MNNFTFKSIGTIWWIEIYDDLNPDEFGKLKEKVFEVCNQFEENYSRFKPTSLISKLNENKELKQFPKELFQMLLFVEKANKATHGYFNPFVGKLIEDIGYDKDYSFKAKRDLKLPGIFDECLLELNQGYIKINPDSKIDLGGFGKGWLIDKVVNLLKEFGLKYFYVNAGGDIYGTSNQGDSIKFELENPFNLDEKIGSILIKDNAIACSAVNRRIWQDKETKKVFHHIINPKVLNFDSEIMAVFTEAKNALDADTASTSIFVSDPKYIEEIASNYNSEFMIIFKDGKYIKSPEYTGELNA